MSLFKKIDTFDVNLFLNTYNSIQEKLVWTESLHSKQVGLQYKEDEDIWSSAVGKLKQNEHSYNLLNPLITDTIFEAVIKKYKLYRTRLMWVNPFSCYSFHNDSSPRIHFPIITNTECMFLFKTGKMAHFAEGEVWWVDTRFKHTFLNTSKVPRLHLVGVTDN